MQVTIFALVGVVVGGLDRLLTATLGGFADRLRDRRSSATRLPSSSSVYLPSMIYGLVILVLLIRPGGLFARGADDGGGARVRTRLEPLVSLLAPAALVLAVGVIGSQTGIARQLEFENALVDTAIVVALYVFIGNSGVISFGHISFVAVGAFLAGILTLEAQQKDFVLPEMFPVLRHAHVGIVESLALAALAGAIYALVVGIPLMRLSGLPAGIATFAVLGITYNVITYWPKIGPGPTALALVPETRHLDADRRRADRDRGRVRLPAQPVRPPAARDEGGPAGGAVGRASTCTASASTRS